MSDASARVTQVYRDEWARIVGGLTRRCGDLDLAEEMAAEAFASAESLSAARDVAEAIAVAVVNADAHHRLGEQARNLQLAMETRAVIEQAKGVLMAQRRVDAEAAFEMPPFATWVRGPENIVRLIHAQCPAKAPGDLALVPTAANGQPAFAMYLRGEDGAYRAFGIHVLSLEGEGIGHCTVFFDTTLFPLFDLDPVLNR